MKGLWIADRCFGPHSCGAEAGQSNPTLELMLLWREKPKDWTEIQARLYIALCNIHEQFYNE